MGRVRGRQGHYHLLHNANYLNPNSKARLGVLGDCAVVKLETLKNSHEKHRERTH